MDFDLDASDLLYIVGIALGVIAVVYFGREIIADLSPTIKSVLLLIAFPTFLVGGNLIDKRVLDKFFYVISVISYLVFLWYSFVTFNLTSNMVFLALIVSSILFIGIGYSWEKEIEIGEKRRRAMLVGLLILMAGFVSLDVAGSQPSYELDLQESVSFEGAWESEQALEEPIPIGKLVVKNDFIFSRFVNPPELNARIYTPEKHVDVHLRYNRWELNMIGGNSTDQFEISIHPPVSEVEEKIKPPTFMENIETLSIEKVPSFPDSVDEPKLVITMEEPRE